MQCIAVVIQNDAYSTLSLNQTEPNLLHAQNSWEEPDIQAPGRCMFAYCRRLFLLFAITRTSLLQSREGQDVLTVPSAVASLATQLVDIRFHGYTITSIGRCALFATTSFTCVIPYSAFILAVGVSEIDYAFEEIQSRARDDYLGDSFNNRPAVSMPRRRARRHGTMMSEKQSMRGWNNHTTDDSGMSYE